MMIRFLAAVGLVVTAGGVAPGVAPLRPQVSGLPFSCDVFSPATSAAALADRFGPDNVKTAPVPWGGAEGDLSEGTILFEAAADAKLEIYWRDGPNKRDPEWVSVRGSHTRWRSSAGITLGTPLRTIEQFDPTVYEMFLQYTRVPANQRLQPTTRDQF